MQVLIAPKLLTQKILVEQIPLLSEEALKALNDWSTIIQQTKKSETQLQKDFLVTIFSKVLGYSDNRAEDQYNLESEQKTQTGRKFPDGVLGFFSEQQNYHMDYRCVIELKGKGINLDAKQHREGINQTPVEQAFGYKSQFEGIEFVIVSNFDEIRLYRDDQLHYQVFYISDLVNNTNKQKEFWMLFAKGRLFTKARMDSSVHTLIDNNTQEEERIEKKFYLEYKTLRSDLFEHLQQHNPKSNPVMLLSKTQKLLDRIIFVCFCEDLNFLPNRILENILQLSIDDYDEDTSLWKKVKGLFSSIDHGRPKKYINKFNGGLFATDEELDSLVIEEDMLQGLLKISDYDFSSDLSVNILGHIFEQSITDMEFLKASLMGETFDKKQSKRKKDGIYYTPEYITKYIVEQAVGGWLYDRQKELGRDQLKSLTEEEVKTKKPKAALKQKIKEHIQFWKSYIEVLKNIKVCDPACGSGAFLVQVFNYLETEWLTVSEELKRLENKKEIYLFSDENMYKYILRNNIYGVDINPESVEITKLSLWLKTANRNEELTTLDRNIKVGNSLIDDPTVETGEYIDSTGKRCSLAFNWHKEFPHVFSPNPTEGCPANSSPTEGCPANSVKNQGFDVVVGNPPYVRQERFSSIKPYLKENYKIYTGVADLYCYFYELGHNILNNDGILGFITSNKWMRAHYGEPLRQFFLNNITIQFFIDFLGKQIFENVGVDTSILILKKQALQHYSFQISHNLETFHSYQSHLLNKDIFSTDSNEEKALLKQKIEKIGTPLKNWDISIKRGILTGYNQAFIIDTKTKEELCKADPKSAEIIKPLLRGRDIHRYYDNWAGLWLIFTRQGIDIDQYKAIKEYLFQFYDHLKPRNNNEQQGRKPGIYKWYEIQDNVAYYKDFEKDKIIYQEIVSNSSFTFDNKQYFIEASAFFLTGECLLFLNCLLNSQLLTFSFKEFYSGAGLGNTGFRYKKQFLEQIPILRISLEQQQPFIQRAETMLSLNKDLHTLSGKFLKLLSTDLGSTKITKKLQKWYLLSTDDFMQELLKQHKNLTLSKKSQWIEYFEKEQKTCQDLSQTIAKTDHAIDTMVYALYGLTKEEINLVENE